MDSIPNTGKKKSVTVLVVRLQFTVLGEKWHKVEQQVT